MSLTLELTAHEIDTRAEATEQLRDQLYQHLLEMNELCSQVRSASEVECGEDDELQDLYAELIEAIEQHHGMISEQLSDLSAFGELPEYELECEAATSTR